MNFIIKTRYNANDDEMGAFTLLTDYYKVVSLSFCKIG